MTKNKYNYTWIYMERTLIVSHTFNINGRLENSRGGRSFNSPWIETKVSSASKTIIDDNKTKTVYSSLWSSILDVPTAGDCMQFTLAVRVSCIHDNWRENTKQLQTLRVNYENDQLHFI
jgi:hypothetical protein